MALFKKTLAQIFAENTTEAEADDHFHISQMPVHLQPWAYKDHRVVEKVLGQGVTGDLTSLNLPTYKRGDEKILREMLEAKKSGFLMDLDGKTFNPYEENAKWDTIHAMRCIESLHQKILSGQSSPHQLKPREC